MIVKIINKSSNPLPEYATKGSAGMDLRANLDSPITIYPQEIAMIPTGIFIELPEGYEAQIRPRSGLALRGITLPNSPATIDSDYRGEIKIIIMNLGKEPFTINNGDRIAQMVVTKYEKVIWQETELISETERLNKGFGSTGIK